MYGGSSSEIDIVCNPKNYRKVESTNFGGNHNFLGIQLNKKHTMSKMALKYYKLYVKSIQQT